MNSVRTGIFYTPSERSGHTSWNVAMRQQLDIYASVVLCKSIEGAPTRHKNVDFAIIRENTEGEYSGLEHSPFPGVVESLKIMTAYKSERIARFAFDFALKNNRKVSSTRASQALAETVDVLTERHLCAQGQHHEARRWSLPQHMQASSRRVQGRWYWLLRHDCRQHVSSALWTSYIGADSTTRSMQLVAKPQQFDVMVMPNLCVSSSIAKLKYSH